jgi:hypothetical protein
MRLSDTQVELRFNNKAIRFPIFVKDSMDFILKAEQFSIGQITGPIDDESRMVLCKKLVDEGFLTIVTD